MYESKHYKKIESKIENLKEGEICGHDLVWVNPKNPYYQEITANNLRDGIGKGIKVYSPDSKEHVALLVDFDYDENGRLCRFIFVYYDKTFKREFVIDTNYAIGWTIVFENHHYKL